jgi:hypothetical protein
MPRYVALPMMLLMLSGGTLAQSPAPSPPAQTNPAMPDGGNESDCQPGAGATVGSGQGGSNLSDKLANSNGVICPPSGVDPQMRKPAPGGGQMPVIPPPGTPGGDQKTIPK